MSEDTITRYRRLLGEPPVFFARLLQRPAIATLLREASTDMQFVAVVEQMLKETRQVVDEYGSHN